MREQMLLRFPIKKSLHFSCILPVLTLHALTRHTSTLQKLQGYGVINVHEKKSLKNVNGTHDLTQKQG